MNLNIFQEFQFATETKSTSQSISDTIQGFEKISDKLQKIIFFPNAVLNNF